jgi:hypothetical protein
MRNIAWLAGSLLILMLAAPADAAHHGCKNKHGGPGMPTFADVDLDGDGSVTEKELMEFRAKRMAARAEEGRKMKNAANAPTFADIDTDGDGAISEQEFAEHHKGKQCKCGEHKRRGDCRNKASKEAPDDA